jgi:hypothetical protein
MDSFLGNSVGPKHRLKQHYSQYNQNLNYFRNDQRLVFSGVKRGRIGAPNTYPLSVHFMYFIQRGHCSLKFRYSVLIISARNEYANEKQHVYAAISTLGI